MDPKDIEKYVAENGIVDEDTALVFEFDSVEDDSSDEDIEESSSDEDIEDDSSDEEVETSVGDDE